MIHRVGSMRGTAKRSTRGRRFAGAAIPLAALVFVVSCGSRTGLFVPAVEATALDAALDAPADAPADVVEEKVPCIPGTFDFKLATPQLMFVIDRSGSMDYSLTDDVAPPLGQPSRWSALADSLTKTILPFTDQIAMGARFFPSTSAFEACGQDPPEAAITPALMNAQTILDVFTSTFPFGATPTSDALKQAAVEVSTSRAVGRAMVLATDGAPNCNDALDRTTCVCTTSDPGPCSTNDRCLDDARTVKTIASIFDDQKIPVYVIGIGVTSSFAGTLDAMAVAGGRARNDTPRYFPGDTPDALIEAFTTIRYGVAQCSYITPSSPDDPNAISVVIAGKSIPRDPTHRNGWDWIDQDFGQLQLFGAACDAARGVTVTGTVTCE